MLARGLGFVLGALGGAALFVPLACGSADRGDLLGAAGGHDASDSGSGGSAGVGGTGGLAGGTGGSSASGGTFAAGGASSGGASSGGVGGAGLDAAGGAGGSGGVGAGGGVGGTSGSDVGVACGNEICGDSRACCFSDSSDPSCIGMNDNCNCNGAFCNSIALACDGHEDCPAGEVCCFVSGITSDIVECRATCENETTVDKDPLCRPSDPVPCEASGEVCGPEQALPAGIETCNPR